MLSVLHNTRMRMLLNTQNWPKLHSRKVVTANFARTQALLNKLTKSSKILILIRIGTKTILINLKAEDDVKGWKYEIILMLSGRLSIYLIACPPRRPTALCSVNLKYFYPLLVSSFCYNPTSVNIMHGVLTQGSGAWMHLSQAVSPRCSLQCSGKNIKLVSFCTKYAVCCLLTDASLHGNRVS